MRHGAAPPAVKGAADETKPMRKQEGADCTASAAETERELEKVQKRQLQMEMETVK